ncbi:hypothetical protein [Pseudonocardia sp. TRM90224]|uniref:hypothetical protein n=1 Tax=Pseudonocardia sp. TRM90224 TaxID=2812678 RepID=UPI001E376E66|nr:hypothetical protein [Pseudonocardia sp. TRM90224]
MAAAGAFLVVACAGPAPAAPPAPQFPPPPDPVTVCIGQLEYWAGEQLRGAPDQGFDYQHMGLTSQQADALALIVERARAEGAGVITPMAREACDRIGAGPTTSPWGT